MEKFQRDTLVGATQDSRITIITPCINRVGMIADALDSVRNQGIANVEHIVVDGGSTDGTLDVLQARTDIELIVGQDRNLYDAINKGLKRATGSIIGLLNSDDMLADGALAIIRAGFEAHPHAPHLTGAMSIDIGDGRRQIFDDPRFLRLRLADLVSGPTLTNSRFLARQVVMKVGYFDTRFSVVSDRDYLIRLRHLAPVGLTTPEVLYRYRAHSGSLTMAIEEANEGLVVALAEAADLRASETAGTPIGRDYARWAAWANIRLALFAAPERPVGETVGRLAIATKQAPLAVLKQGYRHWSERRLKRGRPARS